MQKTFTTQVILIASVFFLFFSVEGFGQESPNTSPVSAAAGTYQFQSSNPKVQELFTTDILVRIEANRDQFVEKIIVVGTVTSVRILPYAVINAPGFIPLSDQIIYIE